MPQRSQENDVSPLRLHGLLQFQSLQEELQVRDRKDYRDAFLATNVEINNER